MKICFDNDGSYDKRAINVPVVMDESPIGYVSDASEDKVTCCIWDRYVNKEQFGFNTTTPEQDIASIGIYNKEKYCMPRYTGIEIIKCKDCKYYIEAHYEDNGEPPYIKGKCKYSKL